ncbi:MAG TPA: amidohydrolase family protein, partial [Pyrinomonadaceae bacterium]
LECIAIAVGNGGKQGLTVEQAVYAYTMGSAFAEFQDKEKGSISVGRLADLVILSNDIFAEKADIGAAKVMLTVAGGRIVYENMN